MNIHNSKWKNNHVKWVNVKLLPYKYEIELKASLAS